MRHPCPREVCHYSDLMGQSRDFLHLILTMLLLCSPVAAQEPPAIHEHQHGQPSEPTMGLNWKGWHVMQDANVFVTFNRQGGPRGETEVNSSNWWMGMFSRQAGAGQLTISSMLSLDPLTTGKDGYSEIFQAGETYNGAPLIDRQHPHDLLMQLALLWRLPLNDRYGLTLGGGPVAEPALGPIAFMHRRSAAENPTAPLGHHTFDSTHIAMGVLTAAVDSGPWVVETSIFHGREPDENRWDLMDPGALDSWSVRGWYRYGNEWTFQASHGFLNEPEELEPGDVRRTTVSASWTREVEADDYDAVTVAFGRNDKSTQAYNAFLAEATRRVGANTFFGRFETLQVETELLQTGVAHHEEGHSPARDSVLAITLGALRDVWQWKGLGFGVGADLTFYGVPDALAPTHGSRPVSFHIYGRVRPPARLGRMWDHFMAKPIH